MPAPFRTPPASTATSITPGSFGCVPMHNPDLARVVRVLEWANGEGYRDYEHALIYAGWADRTPITPTRYGHNAPVVGTGRGHYVVEAAPGGARYRNIGDSPENLTGVLWSTKAFPLTAPQSGAVVTWAQTYLGTPYSWLDYAALTTHRLGIPAPHLQSYIASTGHMICSQYVDTCYARAGIHLFTDGRWPGYVTPAGLAGLVEAKLAAAA